MKKCATCKGEKSLTEFGNNKRNKDGKQRSCKQCQAASDRKYYINNYKKHYEQRKRVKDNWKNQLLEMKRNSSCAKCEDSRHYVLDYHHIDPSTKVDSVADLATKSIHAAVREIQKCVVLCSNCHRELHFLQKSSSLTLSEYLIE